MGDLAAFGVKPADIPGEPTYLHYVARDDDDRLREELRKAVAGRRMMLVHGGSAAGKTRSAAQAAHSELPRHRLLRPRFGHIEALLGLPLLDLGPAVVWLDDLERYAHPDLAEVLRRLLHLGLAVVGTIRRAQLDRLIEPGDIKDPAGEALAKESLVQWVSWRLDWSAEERARLKDHVHDPVLLNAVASGQSPSVYCVAGRELLDRVENAKSNEEWP
jgi:hypothetical protein